MAEEDQEKAGENAGPTSASPFKLHAQFIKGLTFTNPTPLASFTNEGNAQPSISVGIQANAVNLGGLNFEVTLEIRVETTREEKPLFITELKYAGIVSLGEAVKDEEAGYLLMVETARLLFPFARNILADVTHNGGFPPLMLAPVDFVTLYEKQNGQNTAKSEAEKPGKGHKTKESDSGGLVD